VNGVIGWLDRLAAMLGKRLHNYTIATLLLLEAVCVIVVLVFPQDTRLAMAKDVGTTLLGALGIVGGVHGMKAIKGVDGDSPPPPGEASK
jgi:hypothetical protein